MPFGTEKLEWCGYPMVKNFEDTLIRFDRMYERDRHTDRQTDRQTHTPHDGICRACKASRGNYKTYPTKSSRMMPPPGLQIKLRRRVALTSVWPPDPLSWRFHLHATRTAYVNLQQIRFICFQNIEFTSFVTNGWTNGRTDEQTNRQVERYRLNHATVVKLYKPYTNFP